MKNACASFWINNNNNDDRIWQYLGVMSTDAEMSICIF